MKKSFSKKKLSFLIFSITFCVMLASCGGSNDAVADVIINEVTATPLPTPTPVVTLEPTPSLTLTPTPEPTPSVADMFVEALNQSILTKYGSEDYESFQFNPTVWEGSFENAKGVSLYLIEGSNGTLDDIKVSAPFQTLWNDDDNIGLNNFYGYVCGVATSQLNEGTNPSSLNTIFADYLPDYYLVMSENEASGISTSDYDIGAVSTGRRYSVSHVDGLLEYDVSSTNEPDTLPEDYSSSFLAERVSRQSSAEATPKPTEEPDTGGGDVYITKTGEKYHYRDCRTLKRSKSVQSITRKEAQSRGYDPCDVCNP